MGALHLNELHVVALDSEIESVLEPDVTDSVFVSLAGLHGVDGLKPTVFAVDVNAIGPADAATTVQEVLQGGVALGEPVADDGPVLVSWVSVRDWDQQAAEDSKTAEATDGAVHASAGVIEVASDLILDLEVIGVVSAWLNGAVSSQCAVLPRVFPVLDTTPCEQKRLLEEVEDVDHNVIVAGGIDFGSGELAVDEDTLLWYTQWGNGPIGHVPRVEYEIEDIAFFFCFDMETLPCPFISPMPQPFPRAFLVSPNLSLCHDNCLAHLAFRFASPRVFRFSDLEFFLGYFCSFGFK
ncbi:hypothetical protein CR513_45161, partial [Mucuna pruriens]